MSPDKRPSSSQMLTLAYSVFSHFSSPKLPPSPTLFLSAGEWLPPAPSPLSVNYPPSLLTACPEICSSLLCLGTSTQEPSLPHIWKTTFQTLASCSPPLLARSPDVCSGGIFCSTLACSWWPDSLLQAGFSINRSTSCLLPVPEDNLSSSSLWYSQTVRNWAVDRK